MKSFNEFLTILEAHTNLEGLTPEQVEAMTTGELATAAGMTDKDQEGMGRFTVGLHRAALKHAVARKLAQDVDTFKAQAGVAGWSEARALEIMQKIVEDAK